MLFRSVGNTDRVESAEVRLIEGTGIRAKGLIAVQEERIVQLAGDAFCTVPEFVRTDFGPLEVSLGQEVGLCITRADLRSHLSDIPHCFLQFDFSEFTLEEVFWTGLLYFGLLLCNGFGFLNDVIDKWPLGELCCVQV